MNTLQNLPFRLLFLLGLFLANFWYGSPVQVEAQVIPQDQLLVVGVDSEQNSSYRAARSLDGNVATMWHTQWSPIVAPFPHTLTLKLPTSYTVTGLRYLPRQDGNQNGIITAYAIYVSADGITWGTAVTRGTWPGTSALKEVTFPGTQGRYVRLVATAAANRLTYTSAAEINVLGTPRLTPPSSVSAAKSLSWVDSSTNEDGFKIERKVGTTGTFVRLAVVRANTTSYKDADTTTGTPYCYRVQAFNAAGDSPFSNEACTTGQSTTPPVSPQLPQSLLFLPHLPQSLLFLPHLPQSQRPKASRGSIVRPTKMASRSSARSAPPVHSYVWP